MQVAILGVAAFAVLLLALVLWRLRNPDAAGRRLDEAERRLREGVETARQGLDAAVRESAAVAQQAQQRLAFDLTTAFGERLDALRQAQDVRLGAVEQAFRAFHGDFQQALGALRTEIARAHAHLGDRLAQTGQALQQALQERLDLLRQDNSEKLEKMRATVEEKLQSTLEARLGESFRTVSEQLEKVHQGLGEMQSLASGVGDLKRVLSNVKTRGILGEAQLAALLEELLTPEQYGRNVEVLPGSGQRVDFALRLPGPEDGGGPVYLPIDAKFPVDAYERLQEAYEAADPEAVERARKELRAALTTAARDIRDKYLHPPHTTDFALLFLCTEGLYAEALRVPGLFEELQRMRINLTGPSTLAAFLNSLRVGFRTLAIQQRSAEVWRILGVVKTEFGKFGDSLRAVRKKLEEASNKIDEVATRRRQMERALKEVQELPAGEVERLLPPVETGPEA